MYGAQIFGNWAVSSKTATAGTPFTQFIPPWRGVSGAPISYKLVSGKPNWVKAKTHVSQIIYTDTGASHAVTVMRPLNWSVIKGAVAANSSTIVLADDPGAYSTTYKYDLPAAVNVANVANNGIAGSDYVAYQLVDGTWVLDKVSSVSGLTLTMTTATPNVTGGGIADGAILFFFGVAADIDPATGQAHVNFTSSAASARTSLLPDSALATVPALHAGDPLFIYSANATDAGTLNAAAGFYADR